MESSPVYVLDESQLLSKHIMVKVVCYPLREEHFNKLIESSIKYKDWAFNFCFIGIANVVKISAIGAITLYNLSNNNDIAAKNQLAKIDQWEIGTIVISFLIAVGFYILSKYSVTDRSKLINDIKSFYKRNKHE